MPVLHLDFETYSEQDIKKVGGHKYAMDPSTEVLMASYAFDHGDAYLWDATLSPEMPKALQDALGDPSTEIHAFNAPFERLILWHVLGFYVPYERFHCTMVHAWSLGFSGGLGDIGDQMGLAPDKKKLAEGKKLINRFCKPAPKNHKADRYTRETHPEEWARFCEYCVQDTVSEREMEMLLKPYPLMPAEREMWHLDQRVNDRGLPIDMALVHGAVRIRNAEIAKLKHEMNEIAGLKNANSPTQLQAWIQGKGVPMEDMTKATVEATLALPVLPQEVRNVLERRQQASKTSVKKWDKLAEATGAGDRLRGSFQFGGAQRTQRWAGRFFQPQNLPRPTRDDIDVISGILATGDRDLIELIYGDVMLFLSDTIRAAVTAPEGYMLGVCDLGSIESRVLGWESGCTRVNDIFANGLDTYKDFATELFHVRYDEVTKAQRVFSKPPVLGCGYRLGGEGLKKYADGMGVAMALEEAEHAVKLYREAYPEIVQMWYWLDDAMKEVIDGGGVREGYAVQISRDDNFMFIEISSGRKIAYFKPLVLAKTPPWGGGARPTVTYMGMNQYNRKWERLTTHGGKATEQITQATARDILGYQMKIVENERLDMTLVGHVHDEMLTLMMEALASGLILDLEDIMSITPPWAPGLLLGAEGFVTKRYRKD